MTGANPDLIAFASRDAMAARLADLIAAHMQAAVGAHARVDLAVSGGSTPKALYETLSARDLPWNETAIMLVDERWVPADHPRSNEAFVRRAFNAAGGARISGLYDGAATPEEAAVDRAADFDRRTRPLDIVLLGMGDDGHTASWFPHAEGLDAALTGDAGVCAVRAQKSDVTGDEVDRMTLSLSAIRRAKLVVLMMAGQSKRATFERACENGSVEEMPVRAILRARPDIWACWAP